MDILAVAKRAGVSTATVSRVLNSSSKVREETAARVREAIAELQYVPNTSARSLRSGRTNLFGIVVSDIRNPFFPDMIEHFESLAGQHGIDVTFVNTGYSEERFKAGVQRLMERGVDGIAIFTSEVSEGGLQKLRSSKLPVVFLNQPAITGEFRNINVDYVKGFLEAVEHLRMLGHDRIGFVAGPPSLSSAARRRMSFFAAMKEANLDIDPAYIFEGDHRVTGGQAAGDRIFSMKNPPTAVLCSNDMTAVGLLHTAQRLGRKVPDELSLVGFDDLFLTELVQPALTTLHLSRRELATRGFYALSSARDNTPGPQTSVLVPQLVVRASTGPVPR